MRLECAVEWTDGAKATIHRNRQNWLVRQIRLQQLVAGFLNSIRIDQLVEVREAEIRHNALADLVVRRSQAQSGVGHFDIGSR